ncbi:hypothetical protein MMC21_003360 [Puttea exsequens]|nr:hypothetical protein [Puttea exsequens]
MPWHWYLAARSIRVQDFESIGNGPPPDTILEEEDETEEDLSQPASPRPNNENSNQMPSEPSSGQASAASELRMHENTALLACFVFPAIGAWILHFIRAYLSRPSEGLVSNSNLTIFVLAAELRPFSHVLKMIQARTLHLQRVVASNPHVVSTGASLSVLPDLQGRVTELENYVAQAANTASSKVPSPEMTIQIRKSIQPDLDALNRAVRRYEKRQTLYTMQTESRLQELEKRLNDAITLAAAAERSTQSNRQRRSSSAMFGWMATMAVLPFQLALTVITLPGKVVMGAVGQVEVYMGKKIRREVKTAGIAGAGSGSERRRASVRGQKKAA